MNENEIEKLNNIVHQLEEAEKYRNVALEHDKKLKSSWKTFLVTGIILIAAIIALFAFSHAWFVSNNRVHSNGSSISAYNDRFFSIATLKNDYQGKYDVNEENTNSSNLAMILNLLYSHKKDINRYDYFTGLPNLSIGTSEFIDKNNGIYILGDSEGISLMINSENNVNNFEKDDTIAPGSFGKFTFYIIPHVDSLNQVTITISLKAFELLEKKDENNKLFAEAVQIAEGIDTNDNDKRIKVIQNMLKGRMLLFAGLDENGDYCNRIIPEISEDGSIIFTLLKDSSNTSWVKNQAEPVTIYWIWPKRFENFKYFGQENSIFKNECEEYRKLLNWVNENRDCVVNKNIIPDYNTLEDPTNKMSNSGFAKWSYGYNNGDQIIGNNAAFFQWIIEAR